MPAFDISDGELQITNIDVKATFKQNLQDPYCRYTIIRGMQDELAGKELDHIPHLLSDNQFSNPSWPLYMDIIECYTRSDSIYPNANRVGGKVKTDKKNCWQIPVLMRQADDLRKKV